MRKILEAGLQNMLIDASTEQVGQLMQYLELLVKWNKTHNLTSITDPTDMVTLHILDSLSVLPYITGPSLLDAGSGGGLPGLILAIMLPDVDIVSVDTRGKKIQFQTLVSAELGLENFQAVHARVEEIDAEQPFDQIISRAFSSLLNFTDWTVNLIAPDGHWLAMKGRLPSEELDEIKQERGRIPVAIEELTVPNFNGERHLIIFDAIS